MAATDAMQVLYSKIGATGINRKFAQRLLPEWWDDSIADNPSGLLQAQIIIARCFNFELKSLVDPEAKIEFRAANRKFKHSKAVDKDNIQLSAGFATGVARIAAQAVSVPYIPPSPDPVGIRKAILEKHAVVDLPALIDYCFSIGIPVLHIGQLPGKKMVGVALRQQGRAAVVLCKNDISSGLLFHLAHEIGHIALGHLGEGDGTLIDTKICEDEDEDEKQADRFAIQLLNGSDVKYVSRQRYLNAWDLAAAASAFGKERQIDCGHIVLNYGHASGNHAVARNALAALQKNDVGSKASRYTQVTHLPF